MTKQYEIEELAKIIAERGGERFKTYTEVIKVKYRNMAKRVIKAGYRRTTPELAPLDSTGLAEIEDCIRHYVDDAGTKDVERIMNVINKFGQIDIQSEEDIYITLSMECGNKNRGDLLNSKEKEDELWRYSKAIYQMLKEGK